jgi:hypothetical protein
VVVHSRDHIAWMGVHLSPIGEVKHRKVVWVNASETLGLNDDVCFYKFRIIRTARHPSHWKRYVTQTWIQINGGPLQQKIDQSRVSVGAHCGCEGDENSSVNTRLQ